MIRETIGEWVTDSTGGSEITRAFVPHPLPPDPPLLLGEGLRNELDRALLALGRLDSVSILLPKASQFPYAYVRKEAVLSSRIDGARSSLVDLLVFEADETPGDSLDDVRSVSNYVAALEYGLERLHKGFALSGRLLREVHQILFAGATAMQPGEFRRSQNWIGGLRPGSTLFVPPPPERLSECMAALDRFLHDDPERLPVLIKTALAHAQFETLHPFAGGNGRLGRLLVTLLLAAEGVLREPLLYLSLYLEENRTRYFDLLQRIRSEGDWESWLLFFATGITRTAENAVVSARRIEELFQKDQTHIRALGRVAGSALRVHEALQRHPVASIARLTSETDLTIPTTTAALRLLEESGMTRELTGKRRNRLYGYSHYLELLEEGLGGP
jgi:Fic family protein